MKIILFFLVTVFLCFNLFGQDVNMDSLTQRLEDKGLSLDERTAITFEVVKYHYQTTLDYEQLIQYANALERVLPSDKKTTKAYLEVLNYKNFAYLNTNQIDSVLISSKQLIALASTSTPPSDCYIFYGWLQLCNAYMATDSLAPFFIALEYINQYGPKCGEEFVLINMHNMMAATYTNILENPVKALENNRALVKIMSKHFNAHENGNKNQDAIYKFMIIYLNLSFNYHNLNQLDSSEWAAKTALAYYTPELMRQNKFTRDNFILEFYLARYYLKQKSYQSALSHANNALEIADIINTPIHDKIDILNVKTQIYLDMNQVETARQIIQTINSLLNEMEFVSSEGEYAGSLKTFYFAAAQAYKSSNPTLAFNYLEKHIAVNDSLKTSYNMTRVIQAESESKFYAELKAVQQAQQAKVQQIWLMVLGIIVLLVGLFSAVLYNNYKNKQKTNQELELANQKLSYFVRSLSHDILNKLDLIIFSGNVLVKKNTSDTVALQGYYDKSQEAANWLKQYCLDLLNWSESVPKKGSSSLRQVVNDVVSSYAAPISQFGIEIDISDLPTSVAMDEVPLRQVVQNLIDNAIKYSKDAVSPKISIEAKMIEGGWKVGIENNGGVLLTEQLIAKTQSEAFSGGLGIVQHHLKAYGSSLTVEHPETGGTRVLFKIPKY